MNERMFMMAKTGSADDNALICDFPWPANERMPIHFKPCEADRRAVAGRALS
jgi:hypothetical protein